MTNENSNDIVVGLDIGTTKICAIVGRRNENSKIEILGMGKSDSVGVDKNEGVVNVEQTANAIKKAVAEASAQAQVEIKSVYVGIAGQHIKSSQHTGIITRQNTDETIKNQDIQRLIDDMLKLQVDPGEKIINVLPQEFSVDNSRGIKDPRGIIGTRLAANFHIITAKLNAVNVLQRCVTDAGLIQSGITLEPLASSASVLSEEEMEAGVALVDIGGGTTDVAIFKEGIIRHTGVFGYGGNIVTEDIKEGLGVMTKHAEVLKITYGNAMSQSVERNMNVSIRGMKWKESTEVSLYNLSLIIQARMEDIIGSVKSQLINSGFDHKKLIAGIVLTGGGSQLKNLKQLFEIQLGINTRIGYPLEYIANSDLSVFKNPAFSTGIGLIRNGYEDELRAKNHNVLYSEIPVIEAAAEKIVEPIADAEPITMPVAEEKIKKRGEGIWSSFLKTTQKIFEGEEDKNL
ncbi:MAG: cell division protein FtsA [Bacteroidota bacterium]|jgi:cell division protein FtsA